MTIETLLKAYEKALNTNDIDSILALYGRSPVFMPQHAPALVGRDAVRAGYRQVFDTIKLHVAFDVSVRRTHLEPRLPGDNDPVQLTNSWTRWQRRTVASAGAMG